MKLAEGRKKIYTSYAPSEIDETNVRDAIGEAMGQFGRVQREIRYLRRFEQGDQPLSRAKYDRPDIDIEDIDNLASYAVAFHSSYFWANAPTFIQRAETDAESEFDAAGISALNEHMNNFIPFREAFAKVGFSCEVCGIGHLYVNRSTPEEIAETGQFWQMSALDSNYAFVAYFDGIGTPKSFGVTYSGNYQGKRRYTLFTREWRFDFDEAKNTVQKSVNSLGIIPIIEFERFIDRTSCFEKRISSLRAHNTRASDFDNDFSQAVQAIWWMNDAELPVDPLTGETIQPQNGQWVQTFSGEMRNPLLKPLVADIDRESILQSVSDSRKWNLMAMFVPVNNNISGGSSGTAESMASGWEATEAYSMLKEVITSRAIREVLAIILKAITFVSESYIPIDAPIRKVKITDVSFHFDRKHNYDMATKAQVLATLVNAGIDPEYCVVTPNLFDDSQQVAIDSRDMILAIQQSRVSNGTEVHASTQSEHDQITRSPFIDNG